MERKKTYHIDKFPMMPELTDFLPKVPAKHTPIQSKNLRSKYLESNPVYIDSEINLLNKVLKGDLSMLLKASKLNEEKKVDVHLPVLSKKEMKKELTSSISNYRSPTLSPCYTIDELSTLKKPEQPSPYQQQIDEITKEVELRQKESAKRGASAARESHSKPSKIFSRHSNRKRDANLDILLMNRNNSDLTYLMHEYVRRQGLAENSKIFIVTGQHDFMRRALKKRNWVENKNFNSQAYHFKWCYNDSEYDYKNLKPGQIFNHFPSNRELTTKSGLAKNLRNVTDFRVRIDKFFPRCYDFGDNLQIKELTIDYHRTNVLNLLKKVAKGYFVEEKILKAVIAYAESIISENLSKCEKTKNTPQIKPEDLLRLSEYDAKTKAPVSSLFLAQITKILESLKSIFPQFEMEGDENIWIIKPGQNSRGSGVRCVSRLQEILDSAANMQSRVVQKYTESPLLLPVSNGLCKFDMRIWVLVTSFDPLSIYFYNTCYCRICQEPYTLASLDPSIHLANYSVQKSLAKNQSDTVCSLSQLVVYLDSLHASWVEILKKIHVLTICTLQAVADTIDSRSGCFELYGFDIILDSCFQPWLLEVNLSPACAERTEWITEMLDSMGEKLLNIVIDQEIHEPLYDLEFNATRDVVGNTQEWVFLFKACSISEDYYANNTNLEVFGEKFNIKREKNNERRYLYIKAAFVIQRHTRRFLARIKERNIRITRYVMEVQKVLRRKLAYVEYEKRVRIHSAVKIQCFWRGILAKKALLSLRKIKNIEHIQASVKSYLWQCRFKQSKILRSCIYIQCITRTKFSREIVKGKKYYLSCVRRIQRFYQNRFVFLNLCAKKAQKLWRGHCGRTRFAKERRFQNAILHIQRVSRRFISYQIVKDRKHSKAVKTIGQFEKTRLSLKSLSYFLRFRASIVIQKYWRRYSAMKLLVVKKLERTSFIHGMLFIQKVLKGIKERKRFKILRERRSATIIQKYYRGFRARKYFSILKIVNTSARKIQKYYKGYKCRCRYNMMKRVFLQETKKREDAIKLKKDKEKRAIKASERLFKGRVLPDISSAVISKSEKGSYDRKFERIERMKSIYVTKEEDEFLLPNKYERINLIRDVIDEFRPAKRDRSKTRKNKKKHNVSTTQYGKMQC